MSAEKRLKINNSYESEPSSGSSLSEPLVYNSVYDASMHLPYILKPPSYETEVIIQADGNYYKSSQENKIPLISAMSNSLPGIYEEPSPSRSNETVASRPISLESAFKGFTESPYGKLQRQFFSTTSVSAHLPDSFEKPVPTKGNTIFSRFYDMIVEENSCNAVDIQLPNEKVSPTEIDEVSQENGVDYLLSLSKELKPVASNHETQPLAEVELSFNGKIKSLTPPTADEKEGGSIIEIQSQLNQSFILKKYSNEKSPDLFGDDDDDDDENEEDVDTCNYEDRYKAEELIEFVGTAVEEATEIIENENQVQIGSPVAIAIDNTNNDQNTVEASMDTSVNKSVNYPTESSFADEQTCELDSQQKDQPRADNYSLYRENCRREKELLRRIRKCLAGIPPPPSVTIPQLDMFSAVINRKQDILDFTVDINSTSSLGGSSSNTCASLFKPTHPIDETKEMGWRQVLGVRQHGLSFNLCKASENNEYLGLSVIERFIGAETASSYRNSPSSAKKRNARMKLLTQSPGNRLSHLARRRATFSSAQLATQKSNSLRGPQILVDVQKKNKNRRKNTPKRMTPGSKKKDRKTPSSSARKRLFRCDLSKPGPSRESSKRALFQSPAKQMEQKQSVQRLMPSIKPEIANRVEKSKRALFSPDKESENTNANTLKLNVAQQNRLNTQQFDSIFKRKRSAIDDDDSADLPSQSSTLFRGGAENLTPRALKIKSQSFCIGAGSSSTLPTTTAISGLTCIAGVEAHNLMASRSSGLGSSVTLFGSTSALSSGSTAMNSAAKIQRSHSEMVTQTSNLTENQRKKLLWAVSQALQEKKITMKHESFKQYAAVLARVVRRIFQEFFQKSSTSNSETLLRLAKRYVHNVISGCNADDIYLHAKAKIARERSESNTRLSGYIGPEEYRRRKDTQKQQQQHEEQNNSFSQSTTISASISNIFSCDKSMDSICMTSGYETIAASNTTTQSSYSSQSQSQLFDSNSKPSSLKKLPVQPNASLQNSSSKNNMCGLALRENVNFEIEQQRRSTQKNFTGKDQRNVSPYANANSHYYHNSHSNQLIASNNNSIPIAPALCSASMAKSQLQTKSILSAETNVLHPGSTKVKRQISFDN